MKIHQLLTIGQFHTNYCEDYLVSAEIGEGKWLFAVLDGCTMGNESYFAATLTGKILKKIAIEQNFLDFKQKTATTPQETLKEIAKRLFEELNHIGNLLLLTQYDLLTTLILFVFDSQTEQGEILVVGDGVVCINGAIAEYDQGNVPDYLGYHLKEDFETWYIKQNQRLTVHKAQDVSICTDGIWTFDKFDHAQYEEVMEPSAYLLSDISEVHHENMLSRKMKILETSCGLKPTDDLAVIRIIK